MQQALSELEAVRKRLHAIKERLVLSVDDSADGQVAVSFAVHRFVENKSEAVCDVCQKPVVKKFLKELTGSGKAHA